MRAVRPKPCGRQFCTRPRLERGIACQADLALVDHCLFEVVADDGVQLVSGSLFGALEPFCEGEMEALLGPVA